jgi:hypothetical protein
MIIPRVRILDLIAIPPLTVTCMIPSFDFTLPAPPYTGDATELDAPRRISRTGDHRPARAVMACRNL